MSFDESHVLYSKLRPYLNKVVLPDEPGIATSELIALKPDPKLLKREYLWQYLRSRTFLNFIKGKVHGAKMPRVDMKEFFNHEIPLPPLDDQIRIATVLTRAEELIAKRKDSIKALDELLKSTFLEMFGDPVRNEKGWGKQNLESLCTKITDGTHDTPERLESGVKFITGKHIRPYRIDYENSDYVTQDVHNEIFRRCNPEFGDILYTNIGVNLGTAAMNTVRYQFSMKNVALLKPDHKSLDSRYFEHVLNNERQKNSIIQAKASGGAQKFLGLGQVNQIEIPVPPLPLQNQFAAIVEKVEALKAKYQQSLAELENLYGSLGQRAFKGELDLSGVRV